MPHRPSRSLTRALAAAFLAALSLPADSAAQGLGGWLKGGVGVHGRRPKPKDFNKPPDPKEFQPPTAGRYAADPPFFAARNDGERCAAIDLWLSSVRHEATQSATHGVRWRRASVAEVEMERVNARSVKWLATTHFRAVFGKGLPELSEKDAERVAKSLEKCTHQRWAAETLEAAFRDPAQLRDWAGHFAEMEASIKAEQLEAQKQLYRERYRDAARARGYGVAELLKEGAGYSLHASFLHDGRAEWCSPARRQAVVSLLLQGGETYVVENGADYWRRFEGELLPAVAAGCPGAETVYVLNYVDGFYLNFEQHRVAARPDPDYPSDPVSVGVYTAGADAARKLSWLEGDSLSNLTSGGRRTPSQLAFKAPPEAAAGARASVASLRAALRERHARQEAEARLRREREAAERLAREAEEARRAEAERQQKLARDRERHRARAAEVLVLYKPGAPARYPFSGYVRGEALRDIYAGNFEPFTGGHGPEAFSEGRVLGSWLGAMLDRNAERGLSNMLNDVSEMAAIARLRLPVRIAYFAYHQAYEELCRANHEIGWSQASIRTGPDTRPGLFESGRVRGHTYLYDVRTPFAQTFLDTYNVAQEGQLAQFVTGVSFSTRREFHDDFRRFLSAEGCASPAVRHFEVNLYLATEWLLPLQELQPPARLRPAAPPFRSPAPAATAPAPTRPAKRAGARPAAGRPRARP